MNDDSNNSENMAEQWGAFQKIWTDTFSKMMQVGFTFSPDNAPPEILKQMRSGIFQAMTQSWNEYLRSPQFLEATKQWMDSAIAFRKMSNEFLTKARHEAQATAREDVDTVVLAMRHLETRILDRVEKLTQQIDELNQRLDGQAVAKDDEASRSTKPRAPKNPRPT
jgi:hypothetical protein